MKSLLSSTDNGNSEQSLPTLKQWLKAQGKKPIAKVYPVQIVWKPNQYPNITFETEYFKARYAFDKDAMSNMIAAVVKWYMEDTPIAIQPDESRDGTFEVVSLEKENVDWQEIGSNGYRIKWLDKRDSAKPETVGKKN